METKRTPNQKFTSVTRIFKKIFSKRNIRNVKFGGKGCAGIIMAIFAVILYITIVLGMPALWCINVYKLTQCNFEPSYKAEVLYGIGVVSPTCFITAFMDIED